MREYVDVLFTTSSFQNNLAWNYTFNKMVVWTNKIKQNTNEQNDTKHIYYYKWICWSITLFVLNAPWASNRIAFFVIFMISSTIHRNQFSHILADFFLSKNSLLLFKTQLRLNTIQESSKLCISQHQPNSVSTISIGVFILPAFLFLRPIFLINSLMRTTYSSCYLNMPIEI